MNQKRRIKRLERKVAELFELVATTQAYAEGRYALVNGFPVQIAYTGSNGTGTWIQQGGGDPPDAGAGVRVNPAGHGDGSGGAEIHLHPTFTITGEAATAQTVAQWKTLMDQHDEEILTKTQRQA